MDIETMIPIEANQYDPKIKQNITTKRCMLNSCNKLDDGNGCWMLDVLDGEGG